MSLKPSARCHRFPGRSLSPEDTPWADADL
jgi:hypothetical protein